MTDECAEHGQKAIAQAAIARYQVPRSADGAPPDLALAGRADLLSGCAAVIWNHDPAEAEALAAKQKTQWRTSPTPEMPRSPPQRRMRRAQFRREIYLIAHPKTFLLLAEQK